VISLRWLEWGNPTILNLGQNVNTSNPELAIIPEDYQDKVCILRFSRGVFFCSPKEVFGPLTKFFMDSGWS